ncbi:MAG: sugar phosphate isomerase/epimerase [Candidatus Omnitrophica bacterium]|nr:sugar phosphate isomerase/epimerase [Candidatus Omnitrophota bacterium]
MSRLPSVVLLFLLILQSPTSAGDSNPFFAFCMDTHDSQKRSLIEQAEMLHDLGFDGAGHLWLDNLEERIEMLDKFNLKLFQVYLRVNIDTSQEAYDSRLGEKLPMLKDRDVMLALLITGLPPSDPNGDSRAVEIVREIADMASEFGVRVVLYPHYGDWMEKVEDSVRIAKKVDRPNVGAMFNLSHWLKVDSEENLERVLTEAAPHLFAVSLNGADHAAEIQSGAGNFVQPLGEGSFDVRRVLDCLDNLGYQGPIGLQCWGIEGDARDHLARSMKVWREWHKE